MAEPVAIDDLPVVHPETIRRGRTWRLYVAWAGYDGTGCTAVLEVRGGASTRPLLLAPDVTVTVDDSGDEPVTVFEAVASGDDTEAIGAGVTGGQYELAVTTPGGDVYALVTGRVAIVDTAVDPEEP